MVGGFHRVLLLSAKHSRSLVCGKTPDEARFGIPFHGPVIPFGAMVEYHPISAKDTSRLHQCGPKVSPGIFPWICLVHGENLKRRLNGRRH